MSNSNSYIRKTLDVSFGDDLVTLCTNLSEILGDVDGKVNASLATLVTSNISIITPGILTISNIEITNSEASTDLGRMMTPVFTSEVSNAASLLFTKLSNKDVSVISPTTGTTADTAINSPLLQGISDLSTMLKGVINAVFMDCLAIYLGILSATPASGLSGVDRSDIQRLDSNIRWLTYQLESLPPRKYTVIEALRDLQRFILYVKYLDYLFTQSYGDMMSGYETYLGGVMDA